LQEEVVGNVGLHLNYFRLETTWQY
jgi:hypothetical protein